jgi:hypothetical protein
MLSNFTNSDIAQLYDQKLVLEKVLFGNQAKVRSKTQFDKQSG